MPEVQRIRDLPEVLVLVDLPGWVLLLQDLSPRSRKLRHNLSLKHGRKPLVWVVGNRWDVNPRPAWAAPPAWVVLQVWVVLQGWGTPTAAARQGSVGLRLVWAARQGSEAQAPAARQGSVLRLLSLSRSRSRRSNLSQLRAHSNLRHLSLDLPAPRSLKVAA